MVSDGWPARGRPVAEARFVRQRETGGTVAPRTMPSAAVAFALIACAPAPRPAPALSRSDECLSETTIPLAHPDTSIYDTLRASKPPRLIHFQLPAYPAELKRAGIGGEARIGVVIDTLGLPEPASIQILSAVPRDFGPVGVQAVLHSQWCPGTRYGHWVRVRIAVPLRWSVQRVG